MQINKCSLGELKRQKHKKTYWPQTVLNSSVCIKFFIHTSIGFTMMVRAESSHWLLPSLPPPLAPSPRRWMERMRKTPRITMTTKKPTHTMMMTVAAPGTTVHKRRERDIMLFFIFDHFLKDISWEIKKDLMLLYVTLSVKTQLMSFFRYLLFSA